MYTACFKAKEETYRKFEISYIVDESDKSYCIECFIDGGSAHCSASIGNCGQEAAEKLAMLLAKNALRPWHLEEVVSDMRF